MVSRDAGLRGVEVFGDPDFGIEREAAEHHASGGLSPTTIPALVGAGIVPVILGSQVVREAGFVVIGVAFLAAVVAFIAGATTKPTGAPPPNVKFGGKFVPPGWAWYVAAGILIVGMVAGGLMLAL